MAGERLFAVIRTRGAGWDGAQALEGQRDWKGHASFMNALAKDGLWCSEARSTARPTSC
jgi:hypothetical protein